MPLIGDGKGPGNAALLSNKAMYKKYLVLVLVIMGLVFWPVSTQGQQTMDVAGEAPTPTSTTLNEDTTTTATPAVKDSVITLKNPTFEEMKQFILNDPTSRNQFVAKQYECRHFATDVVNNAEAAGIRCGFVMIGYEQGQHAAVAFDTTDRGLIYIEPQTDAAISPVVGGTYQGKVIKEILIAW